MDLGRGIRRGEPYGPEALHVESLRAARPVREDGPRANARNGAESPRAQVLLQLNRGRAADNTRMCSCAARERSEIP